MPGYGSVDWFEKQYKGTGSDPWGLEWRPTQLYRYGFMLSQVRRCLGEQRASSGQVLDIGCATGDFTNLLRRTLPPEPARRVVGVDFSLTAIDRARARYPEMDFRSGRLEEQPREFGNTIDLLTCLEVLYYLPSEERGAAVDTLRSLLRPGGLLLVSTVVGIEPFMDYAQLSGIVGQRLEIVAGGCLTLWPLVSIERLALKVTPFAPRGSIETFLPGHLGFKAMRLFSACCRAAFGKKAESHAYVVAARR